MKTAVWPSRRLKFLASVTPSSVDKKAVNGERAVRLCNYTDVYKNDLIVDGMDFMEATASEEEIRGFRLRAGDVIVTKDSETWEDIAVPAYVPADLPGVVCGYHLSLVRRDPELADGRYVSYAFRARVIAERLHVEAQGVTRFALNTDALASVVFPMPPLAVQCAIAAFLDRKTAEIDALIAKKQCLLELLEEKRTALITQAVTKGVTPGVTMKESGAAWLGRVPAHWDVMRTKFASKLRTGHTPSRQHPEYWVDCTIPWFGLADVWQIRDGRREYVEETAERISELGLANSAAELLPKGTVILSRTASVGFSAIMAADMATTQDFVNWVCGPLLRPEYLLYVFRSMGKEFAGLTMGSTHQTIYWPDVGRFVCPVPPTEEQDAIVAHIRGSTTRLEALRGRVLAAIALLREYRTALITAAVTGQIEVPVS